MGVQDVFELPSYLIESQIRSVMSDIGCDVIKTGMLPSSVVIETVVKTLSDFELPNLVVDPVMIAKGGTSLINNEAIDTVKNILIPIASIVTPNVPEAIAQIDQPFHCQRPGGSPGSARRTWATRRGRPSRPSSRSLWPAMGP